jgi:hypothetical protein
MGMKMKLEVEMEVEADGVRSVHAEFHPHSIRPSIYLSPHPSQPSTRLEYLLSLAVGAEPLPLVLFDLRSHLRDLPLELLALAVELVDEVEQRKVWVLHVQWCAVRARRVRSACSTHRSTLRVLQGKGVECLPPNYALTYLLNDPVTY